ncbi:hypothetical protein O181_045223 [Austropuccinia psidii MF-1]|uniref:Uncharacterized protein n=1 Tax=Austropuccinia psidii MF-1 TaxID=1389203 RepID=A0A9Q3HHE1_9BASI|nr:hypothetical protein [Austropuccinia psidii MF-1]
MHDNHDDNNLIKYNPMGLTGSVSVHHSISNKELSNDVQNTISSISAISKDDNSSTNHTKRRFNQERDNTSSQLDYENKRKFSIIPIHKKKDYNNSWFTIPPSITHQHHYIIVDKR